MILMLFFCLNLSILHFCASQRGYECERDLNDSNPDIFLIEDETSDGSTNVFQQKLNEKFDLLCNGYYNISKGSHEQSKQFKNVIQFAAMDYYDEKPLNNFVYAGNISKTINTVCKKTGQVKPKFDCNEIANLVSHSLQYVDGGNIYDFVQSMNLTKLDGENDLKITHRESCNTYFENTTDLSTVLYCYKSDDGSSVKKVNIRPLTLMQIPNYQCQNYFNGNISTGPRVHLDRLLAILAPEPVAVPFEYQVPTIFYEAPYMFSENKTTFPNSMNLVPWRLLKYGFLKFIQYVGWQRVAIVTDDSEYSIDFEDELTTLFSKEGLAYTVIRCEDAECDMGKVIQELHGISAKVVVANVEKDNAKDLLQSARKNEFEWLFRDMNGKLYTQNTKAFSFSLHSTKSKDCNNMDDNILTGLSSITQAYNTVSKTNKIKKRQFYRLFAKTLKQITPRITEATIKVHRLYNWEEISTMSVNENEAEILKYSNPYKSTPTDGTAYCLVSTYDFHHPCQDPVLMFFMFSLMMFVLTFLLITCYFDKTAPLNDVRYQNF